MTSYTHMHYIWLTFCHLYAYNIVITPIPRMFWAGIIGSVIAGILEVLIYALLQKRVKYFFLASFVSTVIVVIAHGVPTDYFAFKKIFPTEYWQLVISNIEMNIIILTIYIAIASLAMKAIGKQYYRNLDAPIKL